MGGGGVGAQHAPAHRAAGTWEAVHVRRRESAGTRCQGALKLGAVWGLVVMAAFALVSSPRRAPTQQGLTSSDVRESSQELHSLHLAVLRRTLHQRRAAVAGRLPPVQPGAGEQRASGGSGGAAGSADAATERRRAQSAAAGHQLAISSIVNDTARYWQEHGKCVGQLCLASGYLINGGHWTHQGNGRAPPLVAVSNFTSLSLTRAKSGIASQLSSSKLSWFDLGGLFGGSEQSQRRGRYAPNLAGWLQHVPGARPDSLEYSSAGPGWLGYYMGRLKSTTGKKMNMHLHRLLFEACQSSTMDFTDAKNCMTTHGRSPRAALDFLRDIPNIHIDNSKSETAHYVYGSDPYLLGEDWPRSSVSVSNNVKLPYKNPKPFARPVQDIGPPLPAAAASAQGIEEEASSEDSNPPKANQTSPKDSSEEFNPLASCPVLFVTVGQAMHLPSSTATRTAPSTYAQLQIGSIVRKTETLPESASPNWDRQVRIDGPEATVMTVTLYDTSGQSPVSLGAATVPVGGDLEEGFVKLKLKGADGEPVLGDDKAHAQIQLKLRCASASVQSDLIPTGDHCGYGKTGSPDVYDSDCTSGYCAWDCQDISVSLCLSCYNGDCRCKHRPEAPDRLDPVTGQWVSDT